jgi:hypothetical protein
MGMTYVLLAGAFSIGFFCLISLLMRALGRAQTGPGNDTPGTTATFSAAKKNPLAGLGAAGARLFAAAAQQVHNDSLAAEGPVPAQERSPGSWWRAPFAANNPWRPLFVPAALLILGGVVLSFTGPVWKVIGFPWLAAADEDNFFSEQQRVGFGPLYVPPPVDWSQVQMPQYNFQPPQINFQPQFNFQPPRMPTPVYIPPPPVVMPHRR